MRSFLVLCFILLAGAANAAGLRVEPVKIVTIKGTFSFEAEIAETADERATGLMYRKSMASNHAMLFDFGKSREVYFWMKNTLIPLDMIFIKPDGTVASVARNAAPQSEETIPSGEPVNACIEVIAGTAARIGVVKGDKVRHRLFKNAG